ELERVRAAGCGGEGAGRQPRKAGACDVAGDALVAAIATAFAGERGKDGSPCDQRRGEIGAMTEAPRPAQARKHELILLFAPFASGATSIGIVAFAGEVDPLTTVRGILFPALASVLLTLLLVRLEGTKTSWWRAHGRHFLLTYPWLLVAGLSQGEGLTSS